MMFTVKNHGPLILASNYWRSEYAQAGGIFASINAGAIRLLMPPQHRTAINAMRAADYAILSRGPWPEAGLSEAIEILFADHSENPYTLHLGATSFDVLPAEPSPGREWIISAWDCKKGKPHKSLERRCYWRRVAELPCLKPWK